MKIDVFFNARKSKLAIKSLEGSSYGKIVEHVNITGVLNPVFKRNQVAQLLAPSEKRMRTYVRGHRVSNLNLPELREVIEVVFSRSRDAFANKITGELVNSANFAVIIGRKIFAYKPEWK
jgi:hypothetical protein